MCKTKIRDFFSNQTKTTSKSMVHSALDVIIKLQIFLSASMAKCGKLQQTCFKTAKFSLRPMANNEEL
jgi:hypothetical protein